jgi:hypothetical protein
MAADSRNPYAGQPVPAAFQARRWLEVFAAIVVGALTVYVFVRLVELGLRFRD